jgi:hypothetical protein
LRRPAASWEEAAGPVRCYVLVVARIKISDLELNESLDARALERIRGGRGSKAARPRGLVSRVHEALDRVLSRRRPAN